MRTSIIRSGPSFAMLEVSADPPLSCTRARRLMETTDRSSLRLADGLIGLYLLPWSPGAFGGEGSMVQRDRITVLLVDDHPMFAEAITMLLGDVDDIEIVGVAGSGEAALDRCRESCPAVVLMDVDLGGMDGIEASERIGGLCPATSVIIVTALQEPGMADRAIRAGARAFVPKTRASDELILLIRRVAAGELILPDHRAERTTRTGDGRRPVRQLTDRERRVLQLLGEGRSTSAVAQELYISPLTVQTHVKSILAKFGVHSKLEAVTLGLRLGLIEVPQGRPSAPG
jgi:DNA-binding NarL/FixJ family response regulator